MRNIIRNNVDVASNLSRECVSSSDFCQPESFILAGLSLAKIVSRTTCILSFSLYNYREQKTKGDAFFTRNGKRSFFRRALVICLAFFSLTTFSQEILYHDKYVGINIGANLALGTHFQRLGIVINAYYVNDHMQANAETRFYFNVKNLGPDKVYNEAVACLGLVYGYGQKNSYHNPFINSVSNQTGYKYCVAYSYNAYWNKINTSERTGIIALQFDKISFISENDLLAPPSLDRFRTAAFLIQFQYDSLFQAAVNNTIWTGKMGFKTSSYDPHFRFGCYMDTTGSVYPNYSHGLLSAQIKYNAGYSQNVQANIGVDSERIRNIVQNKIIHDMRFLPKKWVKNQSCHIPMLDDKGNQYLYLEGQKLKPAVFYFNWFSNGALFY